MISLGSEGFYFFEKMNVLFSMNIVKVTCKDIYNITKLHLLI